MKEIANFFWEGELSQLEINCIKSFVNNGFYVRLWSYSNIDFPNVEVCDANLVLPKDFKLRQECNSKPEELALLAAFSDYFRYKVVNMFDGWWFDTDCYCLKSEMDYKRLRQNKKVISCKQNDFYDDIHHLGVGAFYMDKETSNKLIQEFEGLLSSIGDNECKGFGFFGPEFFTNFIKNNGLYSDMLNSNFFYEIHWNEVDLMVYPENIGTAKERLSESYLTHIWTTQFKAKGIDKNNPIEGSLLHYLYSNTPKLDVLIVASNYNDFLKITIPNNLKYINKDLITIVTSSKDIDCKSYCSEMGIKCIISDRMYEEDTNIFNRSKAINDGIKSLKNPQYILLLDADICITSNINLQDCKSDLLYSPEGRYMYTNYSNYQNNESAIFEKNNWYGYFQLFNINYHNIDKNMLFNESFNKGIGKEDEWFRDRFENLAHINVNVAHLGISGENWAGRVSKQFN